MGRVTSVLSADESGRVAGKCNMMPAGTKAGYTNSGNKCPLITTFAFLSASELKIKTVKFELCFVFFSPAERTGSYGN